MERKLIEISDGGRVTIPPGILMCTLELAPLFGVLVREVRSNLRAITEAGIAEGDPVIGCDIDENGNKVPDFFGIDVITALAFRLTSPKAALFRKWVLRRMAEPAPADPLERFCSATSVLS